MVITEADRIALCARAAADAADIRDVFNAIVALQEHLCRKTKSLTPLAPDGDLQELG